MPDLRTIFIETAGWFGTIVILIAYGANAVGYIAATEPLYLIANIAGGFGLGINAFAKRAYPLAVLEVAWVAIGVYGLVNAF